MSTARLQICFRRTFARGGSSRKLKTHLKNFHNPATRDEILKLYKFECPHCYARFKSTQSLKSHEHQKHSDSNVKKVQCPYCPYQVLASRKNELYRNHIRSIHPEFKDVVEEHERKLQAWKSDLALRAKIQCFLCSFAGVKISNMHRHYMLVHGYDKTQAERNSKPDPDHPDGALCPQCGEHFVNRHTLIKHLLKIHSKITGEQCFYCAFRYHDIMEHIERSHKVEKNNDVQKCKKCQPEVSLGSFAELLNHTRTHHRKFNPLNELPIGPAAAKERRKRLRLELGSDDVISSEIFIKKSKKKYIPVHLAGICPYCELKFSDLLGHLRHNHDEEKRREQKKCELCFELFGSIRELVSHRQLHPRFKFHSCLKCSAEFETVVQLRNHRKECPKYKRKRKPTIVPSVSTTVNEVRLATASQPVTPSMNPPLVLATLMAMANNPVVDQPVDNQGDDCQLKAKNVDFEGRGTVPCHICSKTFTLKTLLRRHYISHHSYDPFQASDGTKKSPFIKLEAGSDVICLECRLEFENFHGKIKHFLENHSILSGQICPYCDSKWGWKKFDNLDDHVAKYHVLEMQSPVQTCSTCKTNFVTYEDLKVHRQLHEGGNRKVTLLVSHGQESLSIHPMLGAKPEIGNLGGVKCQLCNAFKLRKDHLKLHYIKHHNYIPKLAVASEANNTIGNDPFFDEENLIECSNCSEKFTNHHLLIKHLLKTHCSYSGLICPYCKGSFPQRYIDLQYHVTARHMDQLTGYNVCNQCKVCLKSFSGYAELRDHVQVHGDAYKEALNRNEKKKIDVKKKTATEK